MTWVTDGSGTRWIEIPQRKRRKSPRALRFANLKVGDQLMLPPNSQWHRGITLYFVVTDLWFDPVAGQDDETAGRMVGIRQIGEDGASRGHKIATTLRGLASQRFQYAARDVIGLFAARAAEMAAGTVVGIGKGALIRRRPKVAGL